jgi:hypothetical protein
MAVGRAARRIEREPRFVEVFGADGAPRALDLLEIVEFAWHDCYQEVTPPDGVIDDMLGSATDAWIVSSMRPGLP